MSSGQLTKVDMESRLYKIMNELKTENVNEDQKYFTQKYLFKVLDVLQEYRY